MSDSTLSLSRSIISQLSNVTTKLEGYITDNNLAKIQKIESTYPAIFQQITIVLDRVERHAPDQDNAQDLDALSSILVKLQTDHVDHLSEKSQTQLKALILRFSTLLSEQKAPQKVDDSKVPSVDKAFVEKGEVQGPVIKPEVIQKQIVADIPMEKDIPPTCDEQTKPAAVSVYVTRLQEIAAKDKLDVSDIEDIHNAARYIGMALYKSKGKIAASDVKTILEVSTKLFEYIKQDGAVLALNNALTQAPQNGSYCEVTIPAGFFTQSEMAELDAELKKTAEQQSIVDKAKDTAPADVHNLITWAADYLKKDQMELLTLALTDIVKAIKETNSKITVADLHTLTTIITDKQIEFSDDQELRNTCAQLREAILHHDIKDKDGFHYLTIVDVIPEKVEPPKVPDDSKDMEIIDKIVTSSQQPPIFPDETNTIKKTSDALISKYTGSMDAQKLVDVNKCLNFFMRVPVSDSAAMEQFAIYLKLAVEKMVPADKKDSPEAKVTAAQDIIMYLLIKADGPLNKCIDKEAQKTLLQDTFQSKKLSTWSSNPNPDIQFVYTALTAAGDKMSAMVDDEDYKFKNIFEVEGIASVSKFMFPENHPANYVKGVRQISDGLKALADQQDVNSEPVKAMLKNIEANARTRCDLTEEQALSLHELSYQAQMQCASVVAKLIAEASTKADKQKLISKIREQCITIITSKGTSEADKTIYSAILSVINIYSDKVADLPDSAQPVGPAPRVASFDINMAIPKFSNWDLFWHFVTNLFNYIFGEAQSLHDEEMERRIHAFASSNGGMIWQIKESCYALGIANVEHPSFREVLISRLKATMNQPNCTIPEAERDEKAKKYADMFINDGQSWIDEAYGTFGGQKLSDLQSDTLAGYLLGHDLNMLAAKVFTNAELKDPHSPVNFKKLADFCLDGDAMLAMKQNLLVKLKYVYDRGTDKTQIEAQAKQVIIKEITTTLEIQQAMASGAILKEPMQLDSLQDKAQYVISQFSQGISNGPRFMQVMGDLISISKGLTSGQVPLDLKKQLPPIKMELKKSPELEAAFTAIFQTMSITEILNFAKKYAIGKGDFISALGRAYHGANNDKTLKTGILNQLILQQNEAVLSQLDLLGEYLANYMQTEDFVKKYSAHEADLKTMWKAENPKQSGQSEEDYNKSLDARLTEYMQAIIKFTDNLTDFKARTNFMRQAEDLDDKVALHCVYQVGQQQLNEVTREMQSRIDRILLRMASFENEEDRTFADIYNIIAAEVRAMNEAIGANKFQKEVQDDLCILVKQLVYRALNKKMEKALNKIQVFVTTIEKTYNLPADSSSLVTGIIGAMFKEINDVYAIKSLESMFIM